MVRVFQYDITTDSLYQTGFAETFKLYCQCSQGFESELVYSDFPEYWQKKIDEDQSLYYYKRKIGDEYVITFNTNKNEFYNELVFF
ncbi:hypothetical protein NCTGTJJY_CDS0157 [Serratia phage 92A1]|nr:hypothetical protein NCTGTJJY_CDS0157 [Serratia phage 92A1]